jgi:aryl-alcohol dehydrogenase-like predicted oxidoreductase
MPEAFSFRNQTVAGEPMTVLEAAGRLGLSAVASASLLQSRLAELPQILAARIPGLASSAQRAVQFVRSTPGVTTALVGMKQRAHVEDNLALAAHPLLGAEELARLFDRSRR